ncbi:MAG: hypothetical protein K2V38_21305, partial [Gemmataceae bacterium]|nr:hypothetical protein [Gemmataceae bacterium]
PWLGELAADPPAVQGFAVAWDDDPYSIDLKDRFREAVAVQGQQPGRPRVSIESSLVPFSSGRFARPNPYEARIVDFILKNPNFPRPGERTVIVVPTVSAPARRVLGAFVQASPEAAQRLVAVTGDGISVNTLFRDGEFAWPVRAVPVPLVLFTHADPFDWDEVGDPTPPAGYELRPPANPGEVRHTTEDIMLFTTMVRVLARGAYPDGGTGRVVPGADALAERFRTLSPKFFDDAGNRQLGSGEHVVVLRPTPAPRGVGAPDATLEVWTPGSGRPWLRLHARPLVQTTRPTDTEGDQ